MTRRDDTRNPVLRGGPVVVGVAGGSAAGKSAVVRELARLLGPRQSVTLAHDAFYRDLGHLPPRERMMVNVDHPDSLETDLLVDQVRRLMRGEPASVPLYDFASRTRRAGVIHLDPAPVIIIEGILVLAVDRLRALMDLAAFVDTPEEERLARRTDRDVRTRGTTADAVRAEHAERVQPMHERFVEPSRAWADLEVREGARNAAAVEALTSRVLALLSERSGR